MRPLITINLLVFFIIVKGQEYYPVKSTLFDWKPYDKVDKKLKTDFINTQKNYFMHFIQRNEYSSLTMEDLYNSLHFIDLNKDGISEVVFDGASESEGNATMIFKKLQINIKEFF